MKFPKKRAICEHDIEALDYVGDDIDEWRKAFQQYLMEHFVFEIRADGYDSGVKAIKTRHLLDWLNNDEC